MTTKTVSTNTNQYDPTAMSQYTNLNNAASQGLQANMANPWQAMQGNTQLAQGNQQLLGQAQQGMQGLAQNMQMRGLDPNSPLFQHMLQAGSNQVGMARNSQMSNLLLQAQQYGQGSASAALQSQPLQTGGTTTGTATGVGTLV